MKFHVNLNYEIEAEIMEDAQSIVSSLSYTRSFASGSAKLVSMNMNAAYEATGLIGTAAEATPVGS